MFAEQLQRLKKSAYAEDGSVWEMVEEIVPNYRKTENAKPAQREAVAV